LDIKEITEARLVLIGPIAESVTQKVEELLQYHSNVVAFPVRKQLELIPFLQKFDICLIPFIKNPVTDAISPVKLFEYFSAGKPVVTTNLAECVKYTLIHVAYDHRQFVELVRNILLENPRNLNVTAQQVALNNTWKHRVQQILSVMQLKVGLPET
jgi:hypothetical protein